MTRPLHMALLSAGITLVLLGLLTLAIPRPTGDGLVPNQDVPFYSLPWNDDPFFPGEITTDDGKLANWQTVPSAEFCGQCHQKELREWVSSIHSVSGPDQIYETTIGVNEDAHKSRLGAEKIRWCEACHEPLFNLIGEVNPRQVVGPNDAAAEGTSCIVCHTAVEADPLAGNGSLTLAINTMNDYLDPALILAAPAEHARTMQAKTHNPLMGSSDLCGACHTEIRPTVINGGDPMHLQDTYEEWQNSDYAKMGVQCQDCHMNPNPAQYVAELKRTGQKPARDVSHRFVGINYLLTDPNLPGNLIAFLRGGYPPAGISTEAWQADLEVQRGLIIDLLQEAADLEIEAPASVTPGREMSLKLVVTNSGAGHSLPTGPLDQRHMWLELKVTAANGDTLYHSGWFDNTTGQVDPEAVIYLKLLKDKNGQLITRHILFDVETLEYTRDPIPAKSSDAVPYVLALPQDVEGPLKVEARLWYRLALQEIVKYNLKLNTIVPPVLLIEDTVEIPVE